jgi:diketogulonate reductase-like aldo/keto reductase
MKYETLHGVSLPKIGFGTWKLGGGSYADPKLDSVSLTALKSALELGYAHFDTAEMYAGGHAEELIARAIHETGVERANLFVTTKISPSHLEYDDVLNSCNRSLRRLRTDYIDLYLIHWPQAGMKLEETFRALNQLVRDSKVRHLGVSNFNLKLLKASQELCETPLLTNQVPYNLSDRSYVNNGVLEYCQQNDILLTAYEPLDKARLKVGRALQAIADAHNATPYQIALTWLIAQQRVITIPMSLDPGHIRENFEAADVELTPEELQMLN